MVEHVARRDRELAAGNARHVQVPDRRRATERIDLRRTVAARCVEPHAQAVEGPALVAERLDARPFHLERDHGRARDVRNPAEARLARHVVGAVGVVAARPGEAKVDAARELDTGRRHVALHLARQRVGERLAEDLDAVDGHAEEVARRVVAGAIERVDRGEQEVEAERRVRGQVAERERHLLAGRHAVEVAAELVPRGAEPGEELAADRRDRGAARKLRRRARLEVSFKDDAILSEDREGEQDGNDRTDQGALHGGGVGSRHGRVSSVCQPQPRKARAGAIRILANFRRSARPRRADPPCNLESVSKIANLLPVVFEGWISATRPRRRRCRRS